MSIPVRKTREPLSSMNGTSMLQSHISSQSHEIENDKNLVQQHVLCYPTLKKSPSTK